MKRGNILFMEKGNGASLQEFIESQREGRGGATGEKLFTVYGRQLFSKTTFHRCMAF